MKRANSRVGSKTAAAALAAALLLFGWAPASANPSMSGDFTQMMDWLSHELAQGLAFNAGSTFDPPHEVYDKRLQPDLSLGYGVLPLNKGLFPNPQTPALRDMGVQNVFPAKVAFPNLVAHFRAGLPWRSDFALRLANMTSPPGYKISPTTPASAQSNSIGFSLRKHLLGGRDMPLLSLGAHFNHVYGHVTYNTSFHLDPTTTGGLEADEPVTGNIQWNVNSFGLNAVASQPYGPFIPFVGFGYNYVTGQVMASLSAVGDTFLLAPVFGQAVNHPEQNQARAICGFEFERSWAHMFVNGEIKTVGIGSGKSWIVHTGMSLPFYIGWGSGDAYASSKGRRDDGERAYSYRSRASRRSRARDDDDDTFVYRPLPPAQQATRSARAPRRRELFPEGDSRPTRRNDASPELIFLQ